MAADPLPPEPAFSWPLRDYIAPGLRVVRPDAAFPHMRAGDALHHPWKYLRRDVPHFWYADERFPLMGFMNRDEAVLLHNLALPFAGKPALEIGSWLGWSTCHLALAGVALDVIDPAHDDPRIRDSVERSLAAAGVSDRVRLIGGRSPESIAPLGRKWSFFFIDGDHEAGAPARDALACLPYAADDCAFVFHDLASPAVAAGLRVLGERGFRTMVYQTAQIMGVAWRGDIAPTAHTPDPEVAWQLPPHLAGLPVCGVDVVPPKRTSIRNLRDLPSVAADAPMPSVCIVTSELIGPFKNGGIGTAMTGLAEWLAACGARVTVLYTAGIWSGGASLDQWRAHYAAKGIQLESLSSSDAKHLEGPLAVQGYVAPWLIHRYLAEHRFDVVHFNDCCGEGSLALAAKRLGIAHRDALLSVALHSPSRWVIDANRRLASRPVLAAFDHAERISLASADMVWCPSRYLIDWAKEHDFALPEQTFVQQYVLPGTRDVAPVANAARVPVNEIVFFGRLEERKGLALFCNAIDGLRDELAARGTTVTFLGKAEECGGMPALDFIRGRSGAWRFSVKMLTDFGQPEAIAYLRAGQRLAVMPSPLDNSPCTIYEALSYGVPFLASRTGGIPELIDPADWQRVLFEYGTEGLAAAIRDAVAQGGWIATPSVSQDESRRAWTAAHAQWRTLRHEPATETRALTLAAIVDHAPGVPLHVTVDSLWRCPSVRRVIVVNRSGESLPVANLDLTRDDAAVFTGEIAGIVEDAVLLIHSGVAVLPEAIDSMLQAVQTPGVDGLTPAARVKRARGERIVPPLGGSAAFSLYEGATFTGALLMRREAFAAAVEQRPLAPDTPFLGAADLCVVRNAHILPFPDIALERDEQWPLTVCTASPARVAMYAEASENERYYMLAAGYGASSGERKHSLRRQLAVAAADAGLSVFLRVAGAVSRRVRGWMR